MSLILSFDLFEAQREPRLTKVQTQFLDRYVDGKWSYNPKTGLVNVQGSFDCPGRGLKSLKGLRFGRVTGTFRVPHNRLTSLAGCPHTVGKNFECEGNEITSLEGGPQQVGDYYDCSANRLKSLQGAPVKAGGHFDCSRNELSSLEGAPQEVSWSFWCSLNPLTSLLGAPQKIGKAFKCDAFDLNNWSLEGWLQILKGQGIIHRREAAKKLVLTLLAPEDVASHLRQHPLDLDLLDDHPKLKKQVLQLTDLPDVAGVSRLLRLDLL